MRSPCAPPVAGTVVRAVDRPGLRVPSVLPRPLAAGETGTVEPVFAGLVRGVETPALPRAVVVAE